MRAVTTRLVVRRESLLGTQRQAGVLATRSASGDRRWTRGRYGRARRTGGPSGQTRP